MLNLAIPGDQIRPDFYGGVSKMDFSNSASNYFRIRKSLNFWIFFLEFYIKKSNIN